MSYALLVFTEGHSTHTCATISFPLQQTKIESFNDSDFIHCILTLKGDSLTSQCLVEGKRRHNTRTEYTYSANRAIGAAHMAQRPTQTDREIWPSKSPKPKSAVATNKVPHSSSLLSSIVPDAPLDKPPSLAITL